MIYKTHCKNWNSKMTLRTEYTTLIVLCWERSLLLRKFSRFTITDIIAKAWRFHKEVHIEKIAEDIFKFSFENRTARDIIYQGRPWSFDGVHVIFKEWKANIFIQNIEFITKTFIIHIRGLPSRFMHARTAKMIGSKIGILHESHFNNRVVFA